MTDDQTFGTVLIAVFLVVIPVGMYHRIKSQATREKLDRRREGLFILSTLRPVAAVFWFGLMAWMVNPSWLAWSSVFIPVWLKWVGVAAMGGGAGLLIWTFRSLGRNLTDTVVTRQEHALVFHGPYRWIRHPLYTSAGMLTLGVSLIVANWFLLLTGVVVMCLLIIRTRTEEEHLIARFGDSYRTYMARTGRFLPK